MAELTIPRDPIFPWMMATPPGEERVFVYLAGSPQERMLMELRSEELLQRNLGALGSPIKRPGQA